MSFITLALLTLGVARTPLDVPMPPPPAGMHVMAESERHALLGSTLKMPPPPPGMHLLAARPAPRDPSMPPPPPGMHLLQPSEVPALVRAARAAQRDPAMPLPPLGMHPLNALERRELLDSVEPRMPPAPAGMHRLVAFEMKALLTAAGEATAGPAMPPPPAGMHRLHPVEQKALRQAAESDAVASDDAEAPEKMDEDSAELEELRALEEVALDPSSRPSAELLQSIRRLGFGNPLRQQMQEALEEAELRDDGVFELAPITDLASFDISQVKSEYDIPVEMQPLVATYIHFFQGEGRKWFRKWMGRSTRYIPMMQPILEKEGLPKDLVYLAMIESGFSTAAVSWARAAGPWQFISATGKRYGLKQDFWVDERRDPVKATVAASKYLALLHNDFGHWYLAWAGYNAGAGRVQWMLDHRGTSDFWQLIDGRGFAKETKHYVPKLIACALVAKHPKAFGFTDDEFNFEQPLNYDEVPIPDATDLEVIARAAGVTVEQIHDLNPELQRWCTPPATEKAPYLLRLPKGSAATFATHFAQVAPHERLTFRAHEVKRGDTLSQIAAAYGSVPEAIMRVNGLKNVRALKLHAVLMVPIPSGNAQREGRRDAAFERQVARARRGGYVARPEEEIPAGTPNKPVATGPIKTEQVNGRTHITYGVQSGDSLWAISQRFHCSVEELRQWNNLPPNSTRGLKVGTVLEIWQHDKA
jgi:membrane-bound lytic murein transglycosylase D